MLNTKSTNYDKFICIADKCPASCCKGWEIVIDEGKLAEYAEYKGPIAARLFNGINWEEGTFKQHEKRCAMLGDNEFCDLQLEAGEDMLCKTCRMYPRHVEEFEDVREWSLSLSCPEAARIILDNQEKVTFIEWETKEKDDYDEYEDFDFLMYSELISTREVCIKIIQNRELSFDIKSQLLISLSYELQLCVNDNEVFRMEEITNKYKSIPEASEDIAIWLSHNKKLYENASPIPDYRQKRLFSKLFELEKLNDNWDKILNQTWENWDSNLEMGGNKEIQAEQLLMFWVYTYFCGAVYDDMIFSKMMLAVCATYWIFQIDSAKCFENGLVQSAYSFAREIEHSDENLDALEEWFDMV